MDADAVLPELDRQVGRHNNPPGLSSLTYRIGTRATFSRRMLERLRTQSVRAASGQAVRPLAALTTRAPDDPAVALVDAWATLADVISFYQERIANEGFLRTATERRSVLELARAIGYELSPGVSASAYLTFVVEDAPGAPLVASVAKGTKVQSIPAQDQLPQTFETMEAIEAHAQWNELRLDVAPDPQPAPPLSIPQTITADTSELWLEGTNTRLRIGDSLLIGFPDAQGNDQWRLASLQSVDSDSARNATRVAWGGGALKEQTAVALVSARALPPTPRAFAMRQQAGLFGNVAPDWFKLSPDQQTAFKGTATSDWPNFEVVGKSLDLDATFPGISAGSCAIVVSQATARLFKIEKVSTLGRADFMLANKVTRLDFDAAIDAKAAVDRRSASVFVQSEPLAILTSISQAPADPVAPAVPARTDALATRLTLDRLVSGLVAGRPIVVSGKASADRTASEVVTLTGTMDAEGRTTLHFQPALAERYLSASVSIAANVVRATHGETVADEVLGSGDARLANQRFVLRKAPLTYVAAPTATGTESTLEVRVSGLLWQQVPSLFGLAPRSTAYIVRRDNDGRSGVIFGDGKTGARLPSGQENVTATYRSGMGSEGNVAADSLTLLQTRPLGIRSVRNALPAQGGTDAETRESARGRAPRTLITLGRIVSLPDFEELAQSFTGIGKAQAALLWTGEARVVHLTVADAIGGALDRSSDVVRALAESLRTLGNGLQSFQIDAFSARFFDLAARVWIDPRFRQDKVADAVRDALRSAFSFERRAFGQGVSASEVIAVMHAVGGVMAVDLDRLDDDADAGGQAPHSFLPALLARMDFASAQPRIVPAQLLLIRPDGINLTVAPAVGPVS